MVSRPTISSASSPPARGALTYAASRTRSSQPAVSLSLTTEGHLGGVLAGHRHRSQRLRAEADDHPQRPTRRAGLRR